ncbi:MAG: O-antigen ligase family protein [Limisphaerales bacterium]
MARLESRSKMINPLALIFLLAMCFVMLQSSRRNAVGAILVFAAFIPLGQEIVVAGLHVYFLRILILAGLVRLLMRHETAGFKPTTVDKFFVGWVMVGFVCELIRGPSAQTFGAVYDTFGIYFIVRLLTKEAEDVLCHLRTLAFVAIIIGVCMTWETINHHDLFYVFGGVPKIPMERDGRFRAQGPFLQTILAGTFGATLFPLMIGLWRNGGHGKRLALAGAAGSFVITIASASSGPLFTFLAALAGFCLWPMRNKMKLFRRGIVVVIIGLSLVMKAPIWFLIGKISGLTGGGGYYRSYLIDSFIRHFSQWWLIGTSYTANWAIAGIVLPNNPNMVDITNHYIAQGIKGGVLGLSLFLAVIICCFKIVGRAVRFNTDLSVEQKFLWAFGVCLAAHCTAFISVSYFDQINVFWYWLLAVIAAVPIWAAQKPVENPVPQVAANINESSVAGATTSGESYSTVRQ